MYVLHFCIMYRDMEAERQLKGKIAIAIWRKRDIEE